MENKYAIIHSEDGWLVNIVVWNGDLNIWQPPEGTYALPIDEVDFSTLSAVPE